MVIWAGLEQTSPIFPQHLKTSIFRISWISMSQTRPSNLELHSAESSHLFLYWILDQIQATKLCLNRIFSTRIFWTPNIYVVFAIVSSVFLCSKHVFALTSAKSFILESLLHIGSSWMSFGVFIPNHKNYIWKIIGITMAIFGPNVGNMCLNNTFKSFLELICFRMVQ